MPERPASSVIEKHGSVDSSMTFPTAITVKNAGFPCVSLDSTFSSRACEPHHAMRNMVLISVLHFLFMTIFYSLLVTTSSALQTNHLGISLPKSLLSSREASTSSQAVSTCHYHYHRTFWPLWETTRHYDVQLQLRRGWSPSRCSSMLVHFVTAACMARDIYLSDIIDAHGFYVPKWSRLIAHASDGYAFDGCALSFRVNAFDRHTHLLKDPSQDAMEALGCILDTVRCYPGASVPKTCVRCFLVSSFVFVKFRVLLTTRSAR